MLTVLVPNTWLDAAEFEQVLLNARSRSWRSYFDCFVRFSQPWLEPSTESANAFSFPSPSGNS